jgi:hypothetical protein
MTGSFNVKRKFSPKQKEEVMNIFFHVLLGMRKKGRQEVTFPKDHHLCTFLSKELLKDLIFQNKLLT